MSILRDLLNAGINANDARILEQYFAAEPEFLAGLEQTARCLATDRPELLPPAGEPWVSIHTSMLANGQSIADAFNQALAGFDAPVQMAITGAVSFRMQEIQEWLTKAATSGKKRKTADFVQALSNLGYSFRYNLCSHNIEVNGIPITDAMAAEIRNRMRDLGFHEIFVMQDAYMAEAWNNSYHPIRDYLTELKFQGGDPIGEFSNYFVDDRNLFPTLIRRWMIGACARVMATEQNRMLVLNGPQGLGKDYLAYWLCSPLPEYYQEGPIMPDNKDHRIRLMSTWIWDVNELGSTTRRADREALKSFLTIQSVRERRPFAHFDTQGQAITSFFGTINNEGGFLNDPTGHRRFMTVNIQKIDWDYAKLDVDQLWAQAYDLYISGEPWQPTGDELRMVNEINDEFQIVDIVEEALKEFFEILPGDTSCWMSTYEIISILKADSNFISGSKGASLRPGSEIDTRRLASALTKLGLERTDPKGDSTGKRRRGYYGIKPRSP